MTRTSTASWTNGGGDDATDVALPDPVDLRDPDAEAFGYHCRVCKFNATARIFTPTSPRGGSSYAGAMCGERRRLAGLRSPARVPVRLHDAVGHAHRVRALPELGHTIAIALRNQSGSSRSPGSPLHAPGRSTRCGQVVATRHARAAASCAISRGTSAPHDRFSPRHQRGVSAAVLFAIRRPFRLCWRGHTWHARAGRPRARAAAPAALVLRFWPCNAATSPARSARSVIPDRLVVRRVEEPVPPRAVTGLATFSRAEFRCSCAPRARGAPPHGTAPPRDRGPKSRLPSRAASRDPRGTSKSRGR